MSRTTMTVRQAEPAPVWEAANPLTHTDTMRGRLRGAVHALLEQPGLVGASDPVRMTAVVLAARTSAADLSVEMTARELGRWVGVSASTIGHEVRPHLDREHITDSVNRMRPGTRVVTGIRWQLLPLRDARHEQPADHPLRLQRVEFAVLWGLLEAVCAPGWSHADGTQTQPGLLGKRTGWGAATDRLALLLLVLEARASGVVRLCSGAVDKHGRPAATLARLLGWRSDPLGALHRCSSAEGAQVLGRLQAAGVVEVRRTPGGREQLVIPAVEAAYREMRRIRRAEGRPGGLVPRPRGADRSAGRDQIAGQETKSQVKRGETTSGTGDLSAGLHAYHSPVAEVVDESSGCSGFSGYGRRECCGRPDCACACEDQAASPDTTAASVAAIDGADDALRAERQPPSSPPILSPLQRVLGRQAPQVADILARIIPSPNDHQRDRLQKLVRGLLIEGEDDAMIAARLRDRLKPLATGAEDRPYAFRRDGLSWALTIGLPYTPGGKTTLPCARRGCQGTIRARPTDTVRCNNCELAVLERQQAARPQREAAAPRRTKPCSRCSEPTSAELCGVCWADEETEALITQAVALVAAGCGEPDDPELTAALADMAEKQARARIQDACAHLASTGGATNGTIALTARLTAQSIAHEYRATALRTLGNSSPQAEAEARSAFAAELRRRHLLPTVDAAKQAAQEAGEEARHRTAEHLLTQRSNAWLASHTPAPMAPVPWARSAAYEVGATQARAAAATRPAQDNRVEQPANARPGRHLVRPEVNALQAAADAEETARLRAQIAAEMPGLAAITAAHHGTTYDMPPRPGGPSASHSDAPRECQDEDNAQRGMPV